MTQLNVQRPPLKRSRENCMMLFNPALADQGLLCYTKDYMRKNIYYNKSSSIARNILQRILALNNYKTKESDIMAFPPLELNPFMDTRARGNRGGALRTYVKYIHQLQKKILIHQSDLIIYYFCLLAVTMRYIDIKCEILDSKQLHRTSSWYHVFTKLIHDYNAELLLEYPELNVNSL